MAAKTPGKSLAWEEAGGFIELFDEVILAFGATVPEGLAGLNFPG
jgi:hypothetical protein